MSAGILYWQATGKIVGHAAGSHIAESLMAGVAFLECETLYSGDQFYLLDGQLTERPASPVTLSELTLQGVPVGSTLTINGESYENVEGNIELDFPLPGTYRLRVECWPYRDWDGEVTV